MRTSLADGVATVVSEGEIERVTSMDTSGVAIILKARHWAVAAGVHFSVASTSPAIARLFTITGVAPLLAAAPE